MRRVSNLVGRLLAVQLETCHANSDGTAWYAYFNAEQPKPPSGTVLVVAAKKDGAPLSLVHNRSEWEEVPNALSEAANLRRYYAGAAE
jgi:hypothetical protein